MKELNLDNLHTLKDFFERLQSKKRVLDAARPLPSVVLGKLKEAMNIEWTYNSNSIEGNSLSLRETHLIIQEGVTIRGKSLREHFEAFNHEKAIGLVYQLADRGQKFSSAEILEVHALVMRSIEDEFAGRLRTGGLRISGANFIPPNARKVPDLLDELVEFTNVNPLQLNDLVLATIFHHRFVWIHPFFDGNGRTVRLLMNMLLIKKGYPPAIILKNDRSKYYTALNKANRGDYSKLTLLMAQALERSLNIYIQAIEDNGDDYKPISQLVEEESLPYGKEYLSLLARKGKIDAHKEGRNWVTSKEAIEAYLTKHQGG